MENNKSLKEIIKKAVETIKNCMSDEEPMPIVRLTPVKKLVSQQTPTGSVSDSIDSPSSN